MMTGKNSPSILYEDSDLVVCRKLSGIPVQTASIGRQDMVSMLRNYFAGKKEPSEIFVVHRLDQPVEGVMVFARTREAAAALSRQIQEKSVDKYYLALVEGEFEEASGVLEDVLLRDGKTNTSRVVPKGTKGAKAAKLFYEVKKVVSEPEKLPQSGKGQRLSLVSVRLETGRHHQIRVQMAHAGHPLVGDKKYNPSCPPGYLPVGLCSVKLAFCHPSTGKPMEFTVEPQGKLFHL